MVYKFTKKAQKVLEIANEIAQELGHNYVGTEHILYGLIKEHEGIAGKVLESQNATPELIFEKIEELVGKNNSISKTTVGLTPRTKKVIENSFVEAKKLNTDFIGTEHLLLGVMREADCIAVRILAEINVNLEKLYTEITKVVHEYNEEETMNGFSKNNIPTSYNKTQTLNQFGNDLTKLASEGKMDPVIGRKDETERLIQILSRRTKNNPCLIGESGVGKTAVIEGLAEKIIAGINSPGMRVPGEFYINRNFDLLKYYNISKYRADS